MYRRLWVLSGGEDQADSEPEPEQETDDVSLQYNISTYTNYIQKMFLTSNTSLTLYSRIDGIGGTVCPPSRECSHSLALWRCSGILPLMSPDISSDPTRYALLTVIYSHLSNTIDYWYFKIVGCLNVFFCVF